MAIHNSERRLRPGASISPLPPVTAASHFPTGTLGTNSSSRRRSMLLAAASRAYSGPYPTWQAPTAEACRLVAERLAAVHGWPSARRQQGPQVGCEERRSVLDSLVRTLLSQNTTDVNSGKAFAQLKQRFPRWEAVQQAPLADLIDAIRVSCRQWHAWVAVGRWQGSGKAGRRQLMDQEPGRQAGGHP